MGEVYSGVKQSDLGRSLPSALTPLSCIYKALEVTTGPIGSSLNFNFRDILF